MLIIRSIVLGLICMIIGSSAFAQVQPKFRYLTDGAALTSGESVKGPSRVLDLKGRKGIHPQSIHSVIKLGAHNLNDPKGTVVLWFFALEDLGASFIADHMKMDNPHMATYAFLSDFETPRDVAEANFSFEWNRFNEFRAKFFKGTVYPRLGFDAPQKAWVQAVPFNYFQKHRWYQLAVTWDDAAKSAMLYVNGILIGTSDRFNKDFKRDIVSDTLYAGSPALCHGEVALYEPVLTGAELHKLYRDGAPDFDPAIEKELKHRFAGTDLEAFTFKPDDKWTKQFDCDFQKPTEQIKDWYIQGWAESIKPEGSKEGLLIETPDIPYGWDAYPKQVYIWSEKTFEGNIYVEFEWKSQKPSGLALLMIHASGMGREDFMADYPRKTSGLMETVHGQNVRNYHWEFYREMNDVRNDVGTAFSRKNPFAYRIGFGSSPAPFANDVCHKAQIVQQDVNIRGAIDGKILLEIDDFPDLRFLILQFSYH
ncbi:MAG: DUF1961 family protein [Verrucomicrobia bacterium]|nr:DUF1961 family protein [Verrucomicrobiota bacterium]